MEEEQNELEHTIKWLRMQSFWRATAMLYNYIGVYVTVVGPSSVRL